jgi:hypothetical protein
MYECDMCCGMGGTYSWRELPTPKRLSAAENENGRRQQEHCRCDAINLEQLLKPRAIELPLFASSCVPTHFENRQYLKAASHTPRCEVLADRIIDRDPDHRHSDLLHAESGPTRG